MERPLAVLLVTLVVALVGACQVITLAPGANEVRLTRDAADVSACKAMGNLQVPRNEQGGVDMAVAQKQFRNQAVGLGSNVALVTEGLGNIPVAGIAYQCP